MHLIVPFTFLHLITLNTVEFPSCPPSVPCIRYLLHAIREGQSSSWVYPLCCPLPGWQGWTFGIWVMALMGLLVIFLLLLLMELIYWKPPWTVIFMASFRLLNLLMSDFVRLLTSWFCGVICMGWFSPLLKFPINCLVILMSFLMSLVFLNFWPS